MKKFILFFLLSSGYFVSIAQNPGDDYVFTSDFTILRFNSFTNSVVIDLGHIYQATRGQIFTIRSVKTIGGNKGYSVVFWNFKNATTQIAPPLIGAAAQVAVPTVYHYIDKSDNGVEYFIKASDLQAVATSNFRRPRGILKIDAVVLPIKLRFKNKQPGGEFDLLQSISLGPAISFLHNYGGPFGNSSTSFLLGLNVTNVTVDQNSAPGAVDAKTTLLGLSPYIGFNLEYQGINFNLVAGMDILTGKAGEVWAYRRSPWLGITIGGSLFSTQKQSQ